jgi:hypothetical protein
MKSFFLLIILLFSAERVFGQVQIEQNFKGPPTFEQLMKYEENFKYEVKYGFLTAAWVDVRAVRDTTFGGEKRYLISTLVRSNSKLPFVGTEIDEFNSIFYEDSLGRLVTDYYWKDNIDEELEKEIVYDFDRDSMLVRYKEEDDSEGILELVEPATAGQLVLLISRMHAGKDSSYRFPVYITKELGYIDAINESVAKKRNNPAFDEKVNGFYSEGHADLKGPFGFSGNFKAWYLDDPLRTPLEAHFKVFIGNVRVRLTSYTRTER